MSIKLDDFEKMVMNTQRSVFWLEHQHKEHGFEFTANNGILDEVDIEEREEYIL